jgi:hypothetical protein
LGGTIDEARADVVGDGMRGWTLWNSQSRIPLKTRKLFVLASHIQAFCTISRAVARRGHTGYEGGREGRYVCDDTVAGHEKRA